MDNNLEEKKCPVCGRPNLNKAEKCWYCQAPLEEQSESRQNSLLPEEELLDQSGGASSFVNSTMDGNPRSESDNTPEWLRRVRELIAAEKVEEEPSDEWQQQHLFDTPEKEIKRNSSRSDKDSQHPSSTPEKKDEATQPMDEKPDIKQQEPEEDLPDGFTHFSTHPDDSSI